MHIIFFFSDAAPPTVHEAELDVDVTSSLSFAGVVINEAALQVSAASTLQFAAVVVNEADLLIAASTTIQFAAMVDYFAQLPVEASSTITLAALVVYESELAVDSVSTISFAAMVDHFAQLPIAATSTVSFAAVVINEAALSVSASSSLSFAGQVDHFAQLPITASSTFSFAATLEGEQTAELPIAATSTFSFAGTLVIDATLEVNVTDSISFAAVVDYNAQLLVAADSTLSFTATLPEYLSWRFYFTNTTLNVANTILPHTRQNWRIECEVAFAPAVINRATTYLASNNPSYVTAYWSLRLVRNATTGLLELHGNCGAYNAVLPLSDQRHFVWHKYAIEWEGGTRLRLLVDDVPGDWLTCAIPSHTGNVFTWGWNSLRTGSFGFSLSGFMTNMKAYRDGILRGHWMMGEGSPQPPLSTEEEVTLVQTPVTAGTGYWVQFSSIVVDAQLGISCSSSLSFEAEESAKFSVDAQSTLVFSGEIVDPNPPPYLHYGELLVPAASALSFAATVLHEPFTEFTIGVQSSFAFAAQVVANPEPPGGSVGLPPIEVVPVEAEDRVIETGVTPRRIRCLSRLR